MFESLQPAPPDAILGLTELFNKDPRAEKVNLTVGVYKDAAGKTPILATVKEAEKRLLESEGTKGYLGIDGMPAYGERVRELLFGENHEIIDGRRAATVQTPGGTAALRVAGELLARTRPGLAIHLSKPTWANHAAIFRAAGLDVMHYGYADAAGHDLDFDTMLAALSQIRPGDAVCLHACCHNPSGIDPMPEQWQKIGDVLTERNLTPIVDFAYQGFGEGLAEDAAGLLELCRPGRELLICSSFSKNFGLYGERVGALTIVAASAESAESALSHAKSCVRANYSNPPKHGAAIVDAVIADAELRSRWEDEVSQMRDRIHGMRELFVATMREKAPGHDFTFLLRQRGMFSNSGMTAAQVDELRSKHAVYIVGSGRINVAGMTQDNMDRLCAGIAAVL